MPKRALIEHRPWLFASLIAGVSFYFMWNNALPEVWLMLLKGAGVGFLAVYALRRTDGLDGAILSVALALSSAADMVLTINFETGGALFFASHLVAVALYVRNRRSVLSARSVGWAAALFVGTPAVSYLLSDRADIALYSASLGAMAASASLSRFPQVRIGIGACLFIISDWLIFSRFGPLDVHFSLVSTTFLLPDILVWPTYYAAQFMIATGVVQTLRAQREAPEAFA